MKLENNYFKLLHQESQDAHSATFHVALLPDCDVYRGHFPGNPVCPGVCSMQMIRECAEKFLGKSLHQPTVSQCRFVTLMTPAECPEVDIKMEILAATDTAYTIKAIVSGGDNIYLDYKGEMTV